ncbi:MAG: hypothetical protein ACFFBQ_16945 [Promethearchaeota archaeon]
MKPISEKYLPEALSISHLTRKETLSFNDHKAVMEKLRNWIIQVKGSKRAIFILDNNEFDWQYVNWYFHHFSGEMLSNIGFIYLTSIFLWNAIFFIYLFRRNIINNS